VRTAYHATGGHAVFIGNRLARLAGAIRKDGFFPMVTDDLSARA
jgi:hypothetical protein